MRQRRFRLEFGNEMNVIGRASDFQEHSAFASNQAAGLISCTPRVGLERGPAVHVRLTDGRCGLTAGGCELPLARRSRCLYRLRGTSSGIDSRRKRHSISVYAYFKTSSSRRRWFRSSPAKVDLTVPALLPNRGTSTLSHRTAKSRSCSK